jgi:hypothetical protein
MKPQTLILNKKYMNKSPIHRKQQEPRELPVERRRKRDILKRTFGIGVKSPSKTDTSQSNNSNGDDEEQIVFRKEGEIPELPNFLTLQDEQQLNATYAALKEEGFKKVEEEFQSGAFGGDVTLEEARKIVEYTVEQEVGASRAFVHSLIRHKSNLVANVLTLNFGPN